MRSARLWPVWAAGRTVDIAATCPHPDCSRTQRRGLRTVRAWLPPAADGARDTARLCHRGGRGGGGDRGAPAVMPMAVPVRLCAEGSDDASGGHDHSATRHGRRGEARRDLADPERR